MKANPFLGDKNIFSKVVNPTHRSTSGQPKPAVQQSNPKITFGYANKDTIPIQQSTTCRQEEEDKNISIQPSFKQKSFASEDPVPQLYRIAHTNDQAHYRPSQYKPHNQDKQYFQLASNRSPEINLRAEENSSQKPQINSFNRQNQYFYQRKDEMPSPIFKGKKEDAEESEFMNVDALNQEITRFLQSNENKETVIKMFGLHQQEKNSHQVQEQQNQYKRNWDDNQIKKPKAFQHIARQQSINNYIVPKQIKRQQKLQKNQKQPLIQQYVSFKTNSNIMLDIPSNKKVENKSEDSLPCFKSISNSTAQLQTFSIESKLKSQLLTMATPQGQRIFLTTSQKIVAMPYVLAPL